MAFGWELTMTFLLVAVVYAVAIGKPSFVETGPMAVGFTLWASAFVGKFPYLQMQELGIWYLLMGTALVILLS